MDWKQMLLSTIAGSGASLSYLMITYGLDHYVSYNVSNAVGLLVDSGIDFLLQELVFMRHMVLQKYILIKFIIGRSIFILLNIGLFNVAEPMLRENKHKKYNVLLLRLVLNIFLFVVFLFPIRKYFIYNTNRFFL
jgi:hypothetical protein